MLTEAAPAAAWFKYLLPTTAAKIQALLASPATIAAVFHMCAPVPIVANVVAAADRPIYHDVVAAPVDSATPIPTPTPERIAGAEGDAACDDPGGDIPGAGQ
jgi:hypothetical protein